jgi:Fe-S-cluster containining protein
MNQPLVRYDVPRGPVPDAVGQAARATIEGLAYGEAVLAFRERWMREVGALRNIDTADVLRVFYGALQPVLDRVSPASTCAAGCAYCCHIPLAVFPLEAEVLGQASGRRPVKLRLRQARKRNENRFRTACPFLVAGRCSVYAARPLMCRIHFSFDDSPEWCDFKAGIVHQVAYLDRRPLEMEFFNLLISIDRSSRGRYPPGQHQDIRQWFPK